MRISAASQGAYLLSPKVSNYVSKPVNKNLNTPPKSSNVAFCGGMFYGAPAESTNAEKAEYEKSLMNKFFVKLTDENGNLIRTSHGREVDVLVPGIKEEMDSRIFKFTDANCNEFEGTVKDIIERHIIYDDNLKDKYERMFHGTDKNYIKDILENGPDVTRSSRVVFGPGMYFALSEGDAQAYSDGKLLADIVKTTRQNGEQGKFVRVNGAYYDRMAQSDVMRTLGKLLGTEVTGADYQGNTPYYVPTSKMSVQNKVLNEYCRRILVDELGIDAAFALDSAYHTCIVVFNPDSITNMEELKSVNPYSSQSGIFRHY